MYYCTMATCCLGLLSLSHSKDSVRVTQKCLSFPKMYLFRYLQVLHILIHHWSRQPLCKRGLPKKYCKYIKGIYQRVAKWALHNKKIINSFVLIAKSSDSIWQSTELRLRRSYSLARANSLISLPHFPHLYNGKNAIDFLCKAVLRFNAE